LQPGTGKKIWSTSRMRRTWRTAVHPPSSESRAPIFSPRAGSSGGVVNSYSVPAWLLLAATAAAETVTLSPGDDAQAAIDAAAPGDTLVFSAGTYPGPLTVPPGKAGLSLKAKGAAVLDGRPGGAAVGPVLVIQSDGVQVTGFTIQHARAGSSAEGIKADDDLDFGTIDGLQVRDCRILNCDGPGLLVAGDDTLVDDCLVSGCGSVSITGDGTRLERTTVRSTDDDAVVLAGNDCVVTKCGVSVADGVGVSVTGDRAGLSSNTVSGCAGGGLAVEGGDFTVAKNKVSHCDGGITVGTSTVLGLVESNRISDCRGRGLLILECSELVVRKNVLERCGLEQLPAVHLQASGCTLESNTVRDGDGNAFLVKGDDNLLRKNKALGNLGDGFVVAAGAGNLLESCTAQDNRGEGFQNDELTVPGDATETRLVACKAKGNRRDVAVATAFTELGVSFATGGNDPGNPEHQPEIDD
jgi:parallel beta-helix repeat protein